MALQADVATARLPDSTLKKRYINVNHTSLTPVITIFADTDTRDHAQQRKPVAMAALQFQGLPGKKITNGGHTLPGAGQYLPKFIVGRVVTILRALK